MASGGSEPTQLDSYRVRRHANEPELVTLLGEALADGPAAFLSMASAFASVHDPRSDGLLATGLALDAASARSDFEELAESFAYSPFAETKALLLALQAIAPTEEQRHFARALSGQADFQRATTGLPRWLIEIDRATATNANLITEPGGDIEQVTIEVALGDELMVGLVKVDSNCGFAADDGFAIDGPLESTTSGARELADGMLSIAPLLVSDAGARARDAIARGAQMVPQAESETWPLQRPLVDWCIRLCDPAASSAYAFDDVDDLATEQVVEELIARFLTTPFGIQAARRGSTVNLDSLLWFAAGDGHARPLVWGPMRVVILLTDWFPRKVSGSPAAAASLPDLVRAWVKFAHGETQVPREMTEAVLATIDALDEQFVELYDDDDWLDDDWIDSTSYYTHGSWIRDLVARHVGAEHLNDIPLDELPVESFDFDGVPEDLVSTLTEYVDHIDRCCEALLTDEYRTACYRLLRMVVDADPSIFRRRSANDRGALALIWATCTNNRLFDGYMHTMHPRGVDVAVRDLTDFFGAPTSGHTTRADTMLKAIGRPRDMGQLGLGDPGLLVSEARVRLAAHRDRELS